MPQGSFFVEDVSLRLQEIFGIRFDEHFKAPAVSQFVDMHNPKGTTPLSIEAEWHELLKYSLMLGLDATPTAKFKVPGTKHKRWMLVSLTHNGELRLSRADQQQVPYSIRWVSAEVRDALLSVRRRFLALCASRPTLAQALQSWLLQMLLADSEMDAALKHRIKEYCYSTHSWLRGESQDTAIQTSSKQHDMQEDTSGQINLWERCLSPKSISWADAIDDFETPIESSQASSQSVGPLCPNSSSCAAIVLDVQDTNEISQSGSDIPEVAEVKDNTPQLVVKNTFLTFREAAQTRRSSTCVF